MAKIEKSRLAERETAVKQRIFLALKDWRDDENYRIVRDIDRCDQQLRHDTHRLHVETVARRDGPSGMQPRWVPNADYNEPLRFLDARRIRLRITQVGEVHVLGGLDLRGAMVDEDRASFGHSHHECRNPAGPPFLAGMAQSAEDRVERDPRPRMPTRHAIPRC